MSLRLQKLIEIKNKKFIIKWGVYLAFSVPQNVDCVMWYSKTKSITWKQRLYRQTHQEITHFCNSIQR